MPGVLRIKITFFDQPHIEPRPEIDEVELTADACFYVDAVPKDIPMRYKYNGASIPRIFWPIVGSPFDPDFAMASLVHDLMYLTHKYTRAQADEMLFQLLRQCGVELWRARTMWAFVRSFGQMSWENDAGDTIDLKNLIGDIKKREDAEKFGWLLPIA